MGFFKNLKAIFDPSIRAVALIETQVNSFRRYMNAYPDRDKHAWLAMTLKSRYPNLDESLYYTETWQFSMLSINDAPVALGIYLIHKEGPTSAIPYSEKFLKMMVPVWELVNKKKFVGAWKKENHWTFDHQPWLVNILKQAEEVGINTLAGMGSLI
jgi:hypothetical protein